MITLNDYLYSRDTVLKILLQYSSDLKRESIETHNSIDLAHSNFLIQIKNNLNCFWLRVYCLITGIMYRLRARQATEHLSRFQNDEII